MWLVHEAFTFYVARGVQLPGFRKLDFAAQTFLHCPYRNYCCIAPPADRAAAPMSSRALSSASAADTSISASTPVPSQFVFVIGLTARSHGTPIVNCSLIHSSHTGCAPPPVVSPTIVARSRTFRL